MAMEYNRKIILEDGQEYYGYGGATAEVFPGTPQVEDGAMTLAERPGHGVEFDEAQAAKCLLCLIGESGHQALHLHAHRPDDADHAVLPSANHSVFHYSRCSRFPHFLFVVYSFDFVVCPLI